ncbi:hypothetical protein [Streptomyces sp. NPDC017988]|uniref:hypothetical protein n=1 Tax=Streptomyces sp. NPDC017988 TaxID=3365025 RepID=UPI0037B84956
MSERTVKYTAHLEGVTRATPKYVGGASFKTARKKVGDNWEWPVSGAYSKVHKPEWFRDWNVVVDHAHQLTYRMDLAATLWEQVHGKDHVWRFEKEGEAQQSCAYPYPDEKGYLYCGSKLGRSVALWGPPKDGKRQGQKQSVEYSIADATHWTMQGVKSLVVVPEGSDKRKVYALPWGAYKGKLWMCVQTLGDTSAADAASSPAYAQLPTDAFEITTDPKMTYIVVTAKSKLHRLVRGSTTVDEIDGKGEILSRPAYVNDGDKVWCYWVRQSSGSLYLEGRNIAKPDQDPKSIPFDSASGVPKPSEMYFGNEVNRFNVAPDPGTGLVWALGTATRAMGAAFSFDVAKSSSQGGWLGDFKGMEFAPHQCRNFSRTPVAFSD